MLLLGWVMFMAPDGGEPEPEEEMKENKNENQQQNHSLPDTQWTEDH